MAPEGHEFVHDDHALGMEEREADAFVVEAEEVKFLADTAMVAAACFFHAGDVGVELFGGVEGGAVDAGEHDVVLVAAPVRASQGEQLEVLEVRGVGHVRAAAEVNVVVLPVDVDGVVGDLAQDLDLVGIFALGKELNGRLAGNALAAQGHGALGDLVHLLLDGGKVGLRDGLGELNVVIESVFDSRTDGDDGAGIEVAHGFGKQVGRGVAHDVEAFGRLRGDRRDGGVSFDDHIEIDGLAVDHGGDRALVQFPRGQHVAGLERFAFENLALGAAVLEHDTISSFA